MTITICNDQTGRAGMHLWLVRDDLYPDYSLRVWAADVEGAQEAYISEMENVHCAPVGNLRVSLVR